ncbi:MAG: hypothetical protein QM811_17480 [Pirellulales bacterium]
MIRLRALRDLREMPPAGQANPTRRDARKTQLRGFLTDKLGMKVGTLSGDSSSGGGFVTLAGLGGALGLSQLRSPEPSILAGVDPSSHDAAHGQPTNHPPVNNDDDVDPNASEHSTDVDAHPTQDIHPDSETQDSITTMLKQIEEELNVPNEPHLGSIEASPDGNDETIFTNMDFDRPEYDGFDTGASGDHVLDLDPYEDDASDPSENHDDYDSDDS